MNFQAKIDIVLVANFIFNFNFFSFCISDWCEPKLQVVKRRFDFGQQFAYNDIKLRQKSLQLG